MTNENKTSSNLSDKINTCDWSQGSFFLSSPHDLEIGNSKKETVYLLITHSCDIVHASFKDEPYVEAIPVKAIDNVQGHLTYGKNPRKIHIELYKQKKSVWHEISTAGKVIFSRKKLAYLKPSRTYGISDKNLEVIIAWLAKKYSRAAFPDAFNDRIYKNKTKNKIITILKKNGKEILGLYIRLNTYKNLADNESYKIALYMLLSDEAGNCNVDFQNILGRIVQEIDKIPTIQVPDYAPLTLDEMTARDIATMDYWDFDYLSNRENPGGYTVEKYKHKR